MKKTTWRKHHKWFGIILSFFIMMFCWSGIVLNHPMLFDSISVSRKYLPESYHYKAWNNGLLRGTTAWNNKILIYGNSGIWLTDSTRNTIKDFNQGFPNGADHRNIRAMCFTPSGKLFAAGQYGLYLLGTNNVWYEIALDKNREERLVDITNRGDSVVVTSRSNVFIATFPYNKFKKITLQEADNNDGKVSLFRTIWLLHGGGLFGIFGKILVDIIALVLFLLSVTGIVYWVVPHVRKHSGIFVRQFFMTLHNKAGKQTICFTLFLCLTGWLLRPPGLLAVASGRIPALPFTIMDGQNSWYDNLRGLRYDKEKGDWLLSTSNGFYRMTSLSNQPTTIKRQPEVSVMGINVMEKNDGDEWLIGSFSGLFVWNRTKGKIRNYFSDSQPAPFKGIPISEHAISGYAKDFTTTGKAVDYYKGVSGIPMPNELETLPMSLRNVCIEVHTGRIYTFLGMGTIFYICIIGLAIAWCLWTGWIIRIKTRKTTETKK